MPRDPVCGQYVDENTPFKGEFDTEVRYFCSEECMEEYVYEQEEEEFVEPQPRRPQEED